MRFFNWLVGHGRGLKSAHAIHRAAAAAVEALEFRRLLAVDYIGGILTITGTTNADTITVSVTGTTLNVSGAGQFNGGPAGDLEEIHATLASGDDWIEIDASVPTVPMTLNGDAGSDTLFSEAGPAEMNGGSGSDLLTGSDFNDTLNGGDDGDILTGWGGADVLVGGAGNDSLVGGDGNDTLVADASSDGADTLAGGAGTDKADYSTRSASLTIDLDDAADDGAASEADNVKTDIEWVEGGGGNDIISANAATGAANATLTGGAGNDRLTGGKGNDVLNGGTGNDTLAALGNGDGSDSLYGDDGTDEADYSAKTANLNLSNNFTTDDGESGENDLINFQVENMRGGSGNDNISGSQNSFAQSLWGGDGADTLTGGSGNDTLKLENGNASGPYQYAYGGLGNDTVYGGAYYGDFLYGQDGDDLLISYGDGYGDTVDGGDGTDEAWLDTLDSWSNVETRWYP